jgi:hypothetical protein
VTLQLPTFTDAEWDAYFRIEEYVYIADVLPLEAFTSEEIAAHRKIDSAIDDAREARDEAEFDAWCRAQEDIRDPHP